MKTATIICSTCGAAFHGLTPCPDAPKIRTEHIAAVLGLSHRIDQLHAEARDISLDAAKYLALAWWHAEAEYREESGKCSSGHDIDREHVYRFMERPSCGCCRYFQSLTNRAQLHRMAGFETRRFLPRLAELLTRNGGDRARRN